MIQNLDAHLNKLQTQCDYLRHKLSTFPEGELSIQKNGSYHRWVIRNKEQSVYCSKSNRSLAEVMALKKYYSLLLFETEEELSLIGRLLPLLPITAKLFCEGQTSCVCAEMVRGKL